MRAGAQVSASCRQHRCAVWCLGQRGVAGQHQLHLLFRDRLPRHLVQRLQHFECLRGLGLGPIDLELFKAVRNRHFQRGFNGSDVCIQWPAKMAHAGVVGRRECVAKNQKVCPWAKG